MRWYVLGTRQALIKYSKYSHSRPPSHHPSPFRLGLLTLPYSTAVTGFEGPPCLASSKCICFSMNKKGKAPIQPLQPTFHWAVRIILRSKALISLLPWSKDICGSLSITLNQGPQCLASLSTVNSPLLGTTHFPANQNSAAGSCFSTTPMPPITPAKEKNYVCFWILKATWGYFTLVQSKSESAASKWKNFCVICFSHENSTSSVMNSSGALPAPSLGRSPNITMLNFLHSSSSNGGCQVPSSQHPGKRCINPTGSFAWLSHFCSNQQPFPPSPLYSRDQRYSNLPPKLPPCWRGVLGLPSPSLPHPKRL